MQKNTYTKVRKILIFIALLFVNTLSFAELNDEYLSIRTINRERMEQKALLRMQNSSDTSAYFLATPPIGDHILPD